MSEHLNYDQKACTMGSAEHSEVNRIYQGYSNYCQRIVEKYTYETIKHGFLLNAGGLAIMVGYLGAVNQESLNTITIIMNLLLTRVLFQLWHVFC